MPDMSNIDSEKILSTVGQLENTITRLSQTVGKFVDAIDTLDKGWVSDVKTDFMATFHTDLDAMQEMLGQLYEVNDVLRDAAMDYDKTENETISGVNALR